MTTKTAYIEERSQHQPGGWKGGPDRYVAVQVVPEGQERLRVLNQKAAARRGIEIIYCGAGWTRNQATEKSSLNQARAEARKIAAEINAKG